MARSPSGQHPGVPPIPPELLAQARERVSMPEPQIVEESTFPIFSPMFGGGAAADGTEIQYAIFDVITGLGAKKRYIFPFSGANFKEWVKAAVAFDAGVELPGAETTSESGIVLPG